MERQHVLELVNQVLTNQGKQPAKDDATPMADIGFRSLDFSQVALRIEDELERELNFSAAAMRRITTIRDVIDFFVEATQSSADVA
jgi:acyl carrier protein